MAEPLLLRPQTHPYPLERDGFRLKIGRSIILVKHDLFGKPVSTFPDHASGHNRFQIESIGRSNLLVERDLSDIRPHFPDRALRAGCGDVSRPTAR
jgi:hypothetical protein